MRVLWINERAREGGGCERAIATTVGALGEQAGIESLLLYDLEGGVELDFLRHFDGSFPRVDFAEQLRRIDPDLVYVHRMQDRGVLEALARSPYPVLRFFHDHRLLCPREHKYTAVGRKTCTQPVGPGCLSCMGCLVRREGFPGVGIRSVGEVEGLLDLHRGFSGYVVASQYLRDHLVEHGFPPQRIHVLPLFAHGAETREPRGGEEDYLLFVGSLITGKGVDLLLEALARCQQPHRLKLVGEGRQGESYRALARSLGITDRVEFLGSRSPEELEALYRGAQLVVVPSRSPETFGLVGVEAMSHGVPVVASAVGAMPEWLVDGETGALFPSGDVPSLARVLDRLLGDPEARARMGLAGHARVREKYLARHHLKGLVELLERFRNRLEVCA